MEERESKLYNQKGRDCYTHIMLEAWKVTHITFHDILVLLWKLDYPTNNRERCGSKGLLLV